MTVRATDDRVRVLDGMDVVAIHRRCFDRRQQIEDPEHQKALRAYKRRGRKGAGMNRVIKAVPIAHDLLAALALRDDNIGTAVLQLMRLLDRYGAKELAAAIAVAMEADAPSTQAVRHVLELRQRQEGRKPTLPIQLPDRPEIRDITVQMGDLADFDRLLQDNGDEEEADS